MLQKIEKEIILIITNSFFPWDGKDSGSKLWESAGIKKEI
jgi:hypothetical protein